MTVEYDGVVYGDTKFKSGEIDPVYPDKQVPYVSPGIDCIVHNFLNGWKCINCGFVTPPTNNVTKKGKS